MAMQKYTRPLKTAYYKQTASAALAFFQVRGTPTAYDFNTTSEQTTYRDKDLSAIVPAGTKAVLLNVTLRDNTAGTYMAFRTNGETYSAAKVLVVAPVANVTESQDVVVACDSDRKIEWKIDDAGGSGPITKAQFAVKGFYKHRAIPKGS